MGYAAVFPWAISGVCPVRSAKQSWKDHVLWAGLEKDAIINRGPARLWHETTLFNEQKVFFFFLSFGNFP